MHSFQDKYLEFLFMEIMGAPCYTNPGDDCMEQIMERIKQANPEETNQLLNAAMDRKRELFPEWEISYLAMPKKNTSQWKRTLRLVYKYLMLGRGS